MILDIFIGMIVGALIAGFLLSEAIKKAQGDMTMLLNEVKIAQKSASNAQEYASKAQDTTLEAQQTTLDTQEREKFLLEMINEAMEVVDVKRFIRHRLENAPFHPVVYDDNRLSTKTALAVKEEN